MEEIKKCTNPKCHDPEELDCHNGCEDYRECEYWQNKQSSQNGEEAVSTDKETLRPLDTLNVSWTGNSMGTDNLWLLKRRSTPIVIGVVGLFGAGKTTFLSMLYLLLALGKRIGQYQFSGSYTLLGWENISHGMRWNKNGVFSFPPHTSSDSGRNQGYLHLALRKENVVRDIIFTDVPGEWYSNWVENVGAANSKGAREVVKNADGFIFIVDSKGLIRSDNQRTQIRKATERLANRLKDELAERPLAIIWAKADEKNNINPATINKLTKKFEYAFNDSPTFEVSFLSGEKDIFHKNVLNCIEYVIEKLSVKKIDSIVIPPVNEENYFFKYRGI